MSIISYKCPNCGGKLDFTPSMQKCKCPFCLSTFTAEDMESAAPAAPGAQEPPPAQEPPDAAQQTRVYACPSCGAQVVTDQVTAATSCCYCHNPVVLTDQLSGAFRPKWVIPFQFDRKAALEIMSRYLRKKWFLPRRYHDRRELEKITGLYMPYWLYSSDANGDMQCSCDKITVWSSGDYRYTKTDTYSVRRNANMHFDKIPADASSKADDLVMESISPFDYSALKPFSMSYLSGFLAEKYDTDESAISPPLQQKTYAAMSDAIKNTMRGYQHVRVVNFETAYENSLFEYALLPIWLMGFFFQGKVDLFVMNGQTGKVFGKLPVSRLKLVFLGLGVGLFAALACLLGGMLF